MDENIEKDTKLRFRVSSFLKNIIGRDLITDEFIAIFELVKNSFDANASKVQIIFENQYEKDKSRIIIRDDGIGMNLKDLKEKWLFVAHSDKQDGSEYKDYRNKINRVFAGAKGVGRFSCDRLGAKLNLITIKKEDNSNIENLKVDWDFFEKDSNAQFIDIDVNHKILESTSYQDFKYGTILEISQLRDVWDRVHILKLKRLLEKLINPMQSNDADNFAIEIIADDEKQKDTLQVNDRDIVNGLVKNVVFETLGIKTTQINTTISASGDLICTTLTDRGKRIYYLKERNVEYSELKDINITLFVLNRSAKLNFKNIMGIDSVQYGSVFVYKNGFRIYPFGEQGDDSLSIDRRKQQGLYRYIGTRDLLGRVEVNGDGSYLKETTSRDGGFIKNESWNQLVNFFYNKALRRLEAYTIDTIKWGNEVVDKETGEKSPILNPEDVKDQIIKIIQSLTKADNVIDVEYDSDFLQVIDEKQGKNISQLAKNLSKIAEKTNNPEMVKQAKAVEKQVSELKQSLTELKTENDQKYEENKKIKKEATRVETENLFLKSDVKVDTKQFASLQHHITHTSNMIATYVLKTIDAVNNGDKDRSLRFLDLIILENQKILTLSNFVSKAKFDTMVKKIDNDLISFIYEYVNNVYALTNSNIIFHMSQSNERFEIRFVPIEIIILLDNLLSNSQKAHATIVSIKWEVIENELKFHYINNGNEISDDVLPHIFEYRYTTTNGGGLGLYHVKDIINKMNGSIVVNNKIKGGVEFIITFKK